MFGKKVMLRAVLIGAVLLPAIASYAQPLMQAQIVQAAVSIRDELGAVLPGTDPGVSVLGLTPQVGALVQVLLAEDGIIHPPAADGTPHPMNTLLWETRTGLGVSMSKANQGTFSAAVTPRPAIGKQIFVRVFNRSSTGDASFYGDSALHAISGANANPISVSVTATSMALDEGDLDGDGIHNSWEKSLGSRPDAADSDMDGQSDVEEFIAGTSPTNASSLVRVTGISIAGPDSISVAWESVTGRVYRIESVDPDGNAVPLQHLVKQGNGSRMSEIVHGVDPEAIHFFRLKVETLIPPPFAE